jgi:hypothetical protein
MTTTRPRRDGTDDRRQGFLERCVTVDSHKDTPGLPRIKNLVSYVMDDQRSISNL